MTNIEFLVNELRKAHETIAELRKTNAKLKDANKAVMAHNARLTLRVNELTTRQSNFNLGDLDALALLKKRMEENS